VELHSPEPVNNPLSALWVDLIHQASLKSRVFLTGEGGDETLYPSKSYFYRLLKGLRLGRLALETGQSVFLYGGLPQIGFRSGLRRLWRRDRHSSQFPGWLNPSLTDRLDLMARWQQFSQFPAVDHPHRPEACQLLLGPLWQHDFEQQYDAGTLGYPVEFRHPLIDLRLVAYTLALPPLPWCVDKLLLREAGKGLLPETIIRRGKAPLAGDPVKEMLRQAESGGLDYSTPTAALSRYVNKAALPPIDPENGTDNAENLLSLNIWFQNLMSVNQKCHLMNNHSLPKGKMA
jgi:asparagine synthase (glutamine-hydrolysing)